MYEYFVEQTTILKADQPSVSHRGLVVKPRNIFVFAF